MSKYRDINGNEISLGLLVIDEPEWAKSRIEALEEDNNALQSRISCAERVEKLLADAPELEFTRFKEMFLDEYENLMLQHESKGISDACAAASKALKSEKYSKKQHLGIIDFTAEIYAYRDQLREQLKTRGAESPTCQNLTSDK
jgi:hypothetical protein